MIAISLSKRKTCYVCNRRFGSFTKYHGGSKHRSEFISNIKMVGSDVDNFGCLFCGAHDRERHLFMFFDTLNIWESLSGAKVLHFAPENKLKHRIGNIDTLEYIGCDLFPNDESLMKIDATDIPFSDNYFDFVIANHILEHIRHYKLALRQFFRVLRPGGIAVLQTPYSDFLRLNFEDPNIDTDELRKYFYGQKDHVRVFGKSDFLESIRAAGFKVTLYGHDDVLRPFDPIEYGVNRHESLVRAVKPNALEEALPVQTPPFASDDPER